MAIYIQHKFHGIPSIGYLVMAEDRKLDGWTDDNAKQISLLELMLAILLLRTVKSNDILKTKGLLYYQDILTKLHVHYHIMVICTQNKMYEIQSIAYLVMVEDGINYFNSSSQMAITPLLLRISSQTFMCITPP